MIPIDLQNQVALVTGSSRSIGQSVAVALAKAGASVAVHYHRDAEGAKETSLKCGKNSMILKGDVSNASACKQIVEEVSENYGRLDLVVNNAGIGLKDSLEMPYEAWMSHWKLTLDTNLMSAVNISYWAVRQMEKQGAGKIINISSRSAFRGETEHIAYAVSKAAMVNLTRCLARALASRNILVYAVAPGFIEAGMGLEGLAEHGEEIRAQIPSGRVGTPEDVANVVLFLASGLANYITGSTVDVNGGSYLH